MATLKIKATVPKRGTQISFVCSISAHKNISIWFVYRFGVRKGQKSMTCKTLACSLLGHTYYNHTYMKKDQLQPCKWINEWHADLVIVKSNG